MEERRFILKKDFALLDYLWNEMSMLDFTVERTIVISQKTIFRII